MTRVIIREPSPLEPPPEELPNFPLYSQDDPHWCWAACARMVLAHYSGGTSVLTQCDIASKFFGINCAGNEYCQQALECECVPDLYDRLGRTAKRQDPGTLNIGTATRVINRESPIQALINEIHYILIVGVTANHTYIVRDPDPDHPMSEIGGDQVDGPWWIIA